MMQAMTTSAMRATLIMRVRATCRVPLALMPVTAATAAMSIASRSQVSQVMRESILAGAPRRLFNLAHAPPAFCYLHRMRSGGGIALGILIGVIVGVIFKKVGLGVALGIVFGVILAGARRR